ncbi:MAG: hypothetical protein SO046_00190 [Actinomyces urogenitalis]|nr:hypothetical protein [Actinomyces urogenitalis]MDY3677632.1 hypothetical protein [Actinomyces urogenitalis]
MASRTLHWRWLTEVVVGTLAAAAASFRVVLRRAALVAGLSLEV